ncbi:tRNA:m(4)X modification enzyme TRM13 homolog isoform X2 [Varanus komodoensis]|uniref:tRNA:m(4)X modification enzyme TRM13 homolog isoform X2 n=1 Tax=Varanus komodoensis TaxID=61221 RepID=UPI001CF795CF|nr:tRNA:m(4)X modification enzyme TRM13 homolog isoform X2 [Varanus komodoensis]
MAAPGAAGSPQPGRCAYFVERKRRFCKMVPARGRRFCGEHGAHAEEENSRKRIPCPLDPKHTVYEDQLQKHLKKCNSREQPKPVYFVQDINAGVKDATELPKEQIPISTLSKEQLEDLIRKLRRASNSINYVLKDEILSHQALNEALNDPKNGVAAIKHLKQQASILGHMERLHLLGSGKCFVEFGAGRGKLSHWVDIALHNAQDIHFLLVERATTRFKVDGKHRKNCFERLQVDIQHLGLNKVPVLAKRKLPVIGIGKHVCGAATDLALRCLVETYAKPFDKKEGPAPKRLKTDEGNATPNNSGETLNTSVTDNWRPVAGIVIALCCHHRCDWKHYVGQEFFATVGLGAVEFNYFKRMTSWATCGMKDTSKKSCETDTKNEDQNDEEEEHAQDVGSLECSLDNLQGLLTTEERKQIGQLCKLLIDYGRLEYLQQRGYEAVLQRYTDHSVSLENVLLTAVPCQSPLATS